MKRVFQLISEALEEIEKYGSCESAYYILKYIVGKEELCQQEEIKYDLTIDQLIYLSFNETKYRLFINAFFVYDMLSARRKIQDPMFTFRWGKLYFIYSPRIESHLVTLAKNGFLRMSRSRVKLTERGKEERENVRSLLTREEIKRIDEKLREIEKMKLTDLRVHVKNYLFDSFLNQHT